MKRSLRIVSLMILFASATGVNAGEQEPRSAQPSESAKQQKTRKPLIFRQYWAAKTWDTQGSDFWHSASREVISEEQAANTEAALRLRKQQEARVRR